MPQVYMIVGRYAKELALERNMEVISKRLVNVVEKTLGIEDVKDTAFTAVQALFTSNEADVQIEIRFTAGEDEYGRGKPFEVNLADQDKLIEVVGATAIATFTEVRLKGSHLISLSVWCKPYHNSRFKMFRD